MSEPELPGFPARRAALRLLDAVLRRGQPLETALNAATKDVGEANDRALAHAIASEALRRLPDLDALIDSATRQPLASDSKARMVLRLALVQALVLETPPHAVIATALPLLEGGPRRLVHGVLGTLLRQGARLRSQPLLPPAVEARWEAAWGMPMLQNASAALALPPPTDLSLRDADETALWAEKLGGESLAPGHVRIARDGAIPEMPGFAEGAWWVQNLAASLPARLLGAGEGRAVLDLCAAPGGKTMQLAAAGWRVTSVERDARRLRRVEENLERTQLSATLIEADLNDWAPDAPFPAILLDAPCSATGIFARHPDVLHRVRPRDIADLAALQARLLTRAAGWLARDGRLIYATCSLEPEEGEAIVAVADAIGLVVDPIQPQEIVAGIAPHPKGWIRVLPQPGLDGFFIVRFKQR